MEIMTPSISIPTATPSYGDPLSHTHTSSPSNSIKSNSQDQYISSPLSSSFKSGHQFDREFSDFSDTSIKSSSSTVGPNEEEDGPDGEARNDRSGGEAGVGWMTHHTSTDHLHPTAEEEEDGPTLTKGGAKAEEGRAGVTPYSGANGHSRSNSAATEEETDMDEQSEAKQIQSNLERWAAAERQRRKAARLSRGSVYSGSDPTSPGILTGGTSLLARRLTFGRRSSANQMPSSLATPGSGTSAVNSHLLRKGSYPNSISSSAGSDFSDVTAADQSAVGDIGKGGSGRGIELTSSLQNVPEDIRERVSPLIYTSGASPSTRPKGKERALDEIDCLERDAWGPPSAGAQRLAANKAYDRRGSDSHLSSSPDHACSADRDGKGSAAMKPSASRPIVTPGRRAPSVRRTSTQTPKIVVASDETNAVDPKNPFMTRIEVAAATAAGISVARENGIALRQANEVIPEDDEGDGTGDGETYASNRPEMTRRGTSESVMTMSSALTVRPLSNGAIDPDDVEERRLKRFSTSSKFREIGLDSREDVSTAIDDDGAHSLWRPFSMTSPSDYASHLERGETRRRKEELAEEDRRIIREGRGRQTWWTEWLCGCGRVIDDDNEQTGKTGPE